MSTYNQFFTAGGAAASISATAPLTPATGDIWMDTATDITYLWNGVAWIDITAAAGGTASAAVVSAVAPLTPATGDIWMDTTTSTTYLWNANAWIDITAAGSGITHNYAATAAPALTNDSSQGYAIGSIWIDTIAQLSYQCMSATVGAAVWKLIS